MALTGGSVKVATGGHCGSMVGGGPCPQDRDTTGWDDGCGTCHFGGWLWRKARTGLLVGLYLSCPLPGGLGSFGSGLLLDGDAV
ncbi:hypothetical protein NDU88_004128 [Pleurodeles waltl]|uniref:Uncharacterized protein n=1 Tax=Pleurodeles waltl TaxID=8319 RepID=A0AAV7WV02_PLEWA|nr:hypothetical protein NDU88_004128 [Pleurodeles waltl]